MITKIIDWFIWSSKNADKISLTLKAILTGSVVISIFELLKISMPVDNFTDIIDQSVTIIQEAGVIVTSLVTVYGLVRKLVTTFKGTNDLLNTHYTE